MKKHSILLAVCLVGALSLPCVATEGSSIVVENGRFRLAIGDDAVAKSLVLKATGEELVERDADVPFCAAVQERPWDNENKLAYPNERTEYRANRVRREGDRLIFGFEVAPYEAVVSVKATDEYVAFTFEGYILHDRDYWLAPNSTRRLDMRLPQVAELRFLQMKVRERANFGSWVNCAWDERAAVGVVATEPVAICSSERRGKGRILRACALECVAEKDVTAALLVGAGGDAFLDEMDALERDYGLPRGVASRRSDKINASIYWTYDLCPSNVASHIARAKKGGFRLMLCYHSCFYERAGDYPLRLDRFPNGLSDVRKTLDQVRAAGITPGLHVLQTYVSTKSSLVTPVPDRRIALSRHFTLSRPLGADDTEIYVDENPHLAETNARTRVLRFGNELCTYADFTTERPYKFRGVCRGYLGTAATAHAEGTIGGQVTVSEYGGNSFMLEQDSDLQDQVADKFAQLWRQGMAFIYFDGSEGVKPPYAYHVPNAQYRVWKKLDSPPLLAEGAAKCHFGWHMLSGANAFDVFRPEQFKRMIDRHPGEEAPLMRQDFTRVNFGWWAVWKPGAEMPDGTRTVGTQPDMWEYGTAKAAAWDCPVTVQMVAERIDGHPREDDLLEVIRRWEDVRAKGWLTEDQKKLLRVRGSEHHLYVNANGEYELVQIRRVKTACPEVRLWHFTCSEGGRLMFHHANGEGDYEFGMGGAEPVRVHVAGRAYMPATSDFESLNLSVRK